jgi:hypothetical protein
MALNPQQIAIVTGKTVEEVERMVWSQYEILRLLGDVNAEGQRVLRTEDGNVYTLGDGKSNPRGFGGKPWIIHFYGEAPIVNFDLWHAGTIPDEFKAKLPPNGERVDFQAERKKRLVNNDFSLGEKLYEEVKLENNQLLPEPKTLSIDNSEFEL